MGALRFSGIVNSSFEFVKENLRILVYLSLFLYAVPLALLSGIWDLLRQSADAQLIGGVNNIIFLGTSSLLIIILSWLLYTLLLVSAICLLVKRKTSGTTYAKTAELVRDSLPFFWKTLLLSIALSLSLAFLFLLLIIPALIFSVYWAFAYYVLIYEKKGVSDSMAASRNLVRGKWWKVFGWLAGGAFISSLGGLLLDVVLGALALVTGSLLGKSASLFANLLVQQFSQGAATVFLVVFIGNLYFSLNENAPSQDSKEEASPTPLS